MENEKKEERKTFETGTVRCPWDGKLYESADKFPPEQKLAKVDQPTTKILNPQAAVEGAK